MPAKSHIVVVCHGEVGSGAERRSEGKRDPFFESVACDISHFSANGFKALSFALTDLDREQLQEVTIAVRCAGARALGAIE
jgi:hypothetical protein